MFSNEALAGKPPGFFHLPRPEPANPDLHAFHVTKVGNKHFWHIGDTLDRAPRREHVARRLGPLTDTATHAEQALRDLERDILEAEHQAARRAEMCILRAIMHWAYHSVRTKMGIGP